MSPILVGMALNAKHQLFVKEYLVDRNATRAAKAAGYSAKTAGSQGHELLKKPEIARAIADGLTGQTKQAEARAASRGITKERWLKELELIAFANMDDFMVVSPNGSVRITSTKERKKGRGHVIKKITETTTQHGGSIGLELHNKLPALELIAKSYGWVKDVTKHEGADGGPIVVLTMPANGSEAPKQKKDTTEK